MPVLKMSDTHITSDPYFHFAKPLLNWYQQHGRKDLPWKMPVSPYRVWISEIMLQQTQVQTVIAYFNRFTEVFPTLASLALAEEDAVLALWSGLGYYSRARNLHKTAKILIEEYQGLFPRDVDSLVSLPGIGRSTAGAILSQAFGLPIPILDANVKRVLARFFLIEGPSDKALVNRMLWDLAELCMPKTQCADYTQAIMDLGATCCTNKNPKCFNCPLQQSCLAFQNKLQHAYPTKKIKKQVPLLSQQFLVLINDKGLIYLEKRPPSGVWGGLWCLPALDMERCPLQCIEEHYSLKGKSAESLLEFQHKFSHFHLNIKALSIKISHLGSQLREPSGSWFALKEIHKLGMAKPTLKILGSLKAITALELE